MTTDPTDPTDQRLEDAILTALSREPMGAYFPDIVDHIRRIDVALPVERVRHRLDRLFAERRVGALWHRYCLPEGVAAIRAEWLASLDRCAYLFDDHPGGRAGLLACRRLLSRWDGWDIAGGQ